MLSLIGPYRKRSVYATLMLVLALLVASSEPGVAARESSDGGIGIQFCQMSQSASYVIVPTGFYGFRENVSAYTGPASGEGYCEAWYTTKVFRVACSGCSWVHQDTTTKYDSPAWAYGGWNCGFFAGCSGYRTQHSSSFYYPPLTKSLGLY